MGCKNVEVRAVRHRRPLDEICIEYEDPGNLKEQKGWQYMTWLD